MQIAIVRQQKGFTLTELLIVVIILAILAAIVVPQFASSSDDAKVSALQSNLARLRSSVDLYYQQHSAYPGEAVSSGATCPGGGTAGSGGVNSEQALIDQLTRYTNAAGQSCTTTDAAFRFGPYIKKDALPENPITTSAVTAISTAGVLGMIGDATPAGWKLDVVTGQFIANDQTYDHL